VDEEVPLPDDLPESEDNGAADHLPGTAVPSAPLAATDGRTVDLSSLPSRTVVHCYPETERPDRDVIPDGWVETPGSRVCTPEARGFRDRYRDLRERDVSELFGLSVQSSDYQREVRDRFEVLFELLSDADLALSD